MEEATPRAFHFTFKPPALRAVDSNFLFSSPSSYFHLVAPQKIGACAPTTTNCGLKSEGSEARKNQFFMAVGGGGVLRVLLPRHTYSK